MTHLLLALVARFLLGSGPPPEDLPKTAHAMYSLKAAMKWDEDVSFLTLYISQFLDDYLVNAQSQEFLVLFRSLV